ncbi:hypothetical protein QBC42DRAFT_344013 [Cladorrhinum samala]|uniref:Glucose-methanol-choline oxidoreductase N-terminal domain-containing protein n=1 Tax=Cladorrhinum samala TaxID=585594 RepID=A0AAV9HX15_9PEZI|nr:hypothetical protein QBC42DRAFT_344013 [Cladorrhinum samala]
MLLKQLLSLGLASVSLAQNVKLTGYEYIVVGSGAGGGPVAARLAMAGHKTLLIEAGNDQGNNINYTVPTYHARSSEDPKMAWNFFVRHYSDDQQQARDWKTSYDTPDGSVYTGSNPPAGSKMKGVLYPRTGTLGGCTAHNAMIAIYPHNSDFDYMATLTGDSSWSAENMRKYFIKMENKRYLEADLYPGHGRNGWFSTEVAPLTIPLTDPLLFGTLTGGAFALGNITNQILNVGTLLAGDINSNNPARDRTQAYYQIPLSTNNHARIGTREFLLAVANARNSDGTKKYPLDIRLNSHVTRITFDTSSETPVATGVEFLDGANLYRASPLSSESNPRTKGSASASREVIISGGTYNSPQILKLSGIGPRDELSQHGIETIVDLPGVGTNLQDHYEISVNWHAPAEYSTLQGCTFFLNGSTSDPCLDKWNNPSPILRDRGTYASNGLAAAMLYKSSDSRAGNGEFDALVFGGPATFQGYYPTYSVDATSRRDLWTWAILKPHPRSHAGSVKLRSSDPLDVPDIMYRYYEDGSSASDADADLSTMTEAIRLARDAIKRAPVLGRFREDRPGTAVDSDEQIKQYIRDQTWGHHASSTCPIGPDGDPMAVLDSKFRVRGVKGLRVVDASVYPRIPGTFTAISTAMAGEKAADDILADI